MKKSKKLEDGIPIWDDRVVSYRMSLVEKLCRIMNDNPSAVNLADYSHPKMKTFA